MALHSGTESRGVTQAIAETWLNLRIALAFLTRLQVSPPPPPEPATSGYLARATGLFPLVGAGVGALAAVAYVGGLGLGLPALACAFIAVGVATFATGALHEDGLADVFDGLGGGHGRDERLRIMRDSRIGSFGALALVFSTGLRAALLADLATPGVAAAALIATGAISRAPLPAILHWVPSARPDGLASSAGRPGLVPVAIASVSAAAIALVALHPIAAIAVLLAAAGAATLMAWIGYRAVGGHTGDILGAAQQMAEIAALAAVVVAA